ncbi:hypothetical protein B0H11DRAFT_1914127 [Mycena galericulata]|nr:hypothetical protein B0H11DRAFT_1914127 [Mycena galericulata]
MRLRALPEVPGSMLESDTSELHSAPANERNIRKDFLPPFSSSPHFQWPAFAVRRVARMKSAKWCGGVQSLAGTVCLPSATSRLWNLKMRRSTESRPPPLPSVRCVAPKESKDTTVYRLAVSSFTGIHRVSHERRLACKPRAATLVYHHWASPRQPRASLACKPRSSDRVSPAKFKTSRPGLKTSRSRPQDPTSRPQDQDLKTRPQDSRLQDWPKTAAPLGIIRVSLGGPPRVATVPVFKSLGIPASASSILLRNKPRRAAPCKPHVRDPQDLKTWRQDLQDLQDLPVAARYQDLQDLKSQDVQDHQDLQDLPVAARHQDLQDLKSQDVQDHQDVQDLPQDMKTFKAIKTVKTQDHQDFKTKNQAVQDVQDSAIYPRINHLLFSQAEKRQSQFELSSKDSIDINTIRTGQPTQDSLFESASSLMTGAV